MTDNKPLSLNVIQDSLPKNISKSVDQEFVDLLNNISKDPYATEAIKENFLSYTKVLQDGKYKLKDYLNAVSYVTYKLMGYSNLDSYIKTFPTRYAEMKLRSLSDKEISAYVAAYNKNKLVNNILEQSLVPTWVLNQDAYQKAINTQVALMATASSERVRAMAADSILNHLKRPEASAPAVNINLGSASNNGIEDLRDTITKLAQTQKELIQSGLTAKSIAEQKIIDVEPEEDDAN